MSVQPRLVSFCPSSLGTAGATFRDAKGHTVCDIEEGGEDEGPADKDREKVTLQPLLGGEALRRGAGAGELIEGAGRRTGRAVVGRSAPARVAGGVAAGTDAGCVGGGSLDTAVVARRAVGQAGAPVGEQRAAAVCGGRVASARLRGQKHRPLLPKDLPSHVPCASHLRHLSVAEAAKCLAVISSSVPWRCRMKLVSRPGGRRDRVQR